MEPSTAAPADRFVRSLIDFALLPQGEAEQLARQGRDPREMARDLVKRQKLTRFQAAMLLQGRILVLDNYVILDTLGEGGMGQVFKAQHRGLKRIVALKVLSPNVVKNPLALKRFEREVRAAAKLNHPNIVAARDAGQANGVHFLVMEYVNGCDLSRWVKQHGPLLPAQAIDCIKQAATGLAHAHAAGIIHRDIKPSNLILASGGSNPPGPLGVVKILDMGLARIDAAGESAGNETSAPDELTKTGSIMGTCDYIAPEQAMNAKTADHRADIYSLGCTLYFLLTGKPPYDGETGMEKVFAHREKPTPQLPAAVRHLQPLFAKLVAKRPEDRYQTMTELLAALDNLGKEPKRRRKLPLILAGGGMIAAAGLVLVLTLGSDSKPSAADPKPAVVVQPSTGMLVVTPARTTEPIYYDVRGPGQGNPPMKPPGGFKGKNPDSPWMKDRPGGPGGKMDREMDRIREMQKLDGTADRLREMQKQLIKPIEDQPVQPRQ